MATKNDKKTFLKWVGGKQKIMKTILSHIPFGTFKVYCEPFIGGGSVFLSLPEVSSDIEYHLSDINKELITTYTYLKKDYKELIKVLEDYYHKHSEDFYYQLRSINPDTISPLEVAARMIYLNKAGFNGLYRVNSKNEFNVPYNHKEKEKISLYDEQVLMNAHQRLQFATTIEHKHFTEALKERQVMQPTFIYLDPPYHNTFTQYCAEKFTEDEQKKLWEFTMGAVEINQLNGNAFFKVLQSNSDTPFIRELYGTLNIIEIHAPRSVNNAVHESKVQELLIKNY